MSSRLKRLALFGVLLLLVFLSPSCTSKPGAVIEQWEIKGPKFRIRVIARKEKYSAIPGAYYAFQSGTMNSEVWSDIFVFLHDDAVPIPRDQIRLLTDDIGYVFMGWEYAVTTDAGTHWTIWDGDVQIPQISYHNYQLIRDVRMTSDGRGEMSILPANNKAVRLTTADFGRHWIMSR